MMYFIKKKNFPFFFLFNFFKIIFIKILLIKVLLVKRKVTFEITIKFNKLSIIRFFTFFKLHFIFILFIILDFKLYKLEDSNKKKYNKILYKYLKIKAKKFREKLNLFF